MSSLRDKVTIITGASSGLGAGFATYFASLGAKLVLTGRNGTRLQHVADECARVGLPKAHILQVVADVTKDSDLEMIMERTISMFSRLDVLINNAGILSVGSVARSHMSTYDQIMNTNIRAPYNLTRLAIPHLKKTKGVIVNISSVAGIIVSPGMAVYSVSKAALDHLTKCVASELGQYGVRVNAVNVGTVSTNLLEASGVPAEQADMTFQALGGLHALRRIGRIDEIANVVGFMASDDSSFITGACIPVEGGMLVVGSKI